MHWETQHLKKDWGVYPEIDLVRKSTNFLNQIRSRYGSLPRCLDLGCGIGANTIMLRDIGFQVTAIDGSPTAIKKLTERTDTLNINAQVLDFSNLKELKGPFDLIVDNLSLYANHPSNIKLYLTDLCTLMNSETLFYSRVWGKKTTGLTDVGKYFYNNPEIGPCSHTGETTVYDLKLIDSMYGEFFTTVVDELLCTYNTSEVWQEFVVCARLKKI